MKQNRRTMMIVAVIAALVLFAVFLRIAAREIDIPFVDKLLTFLRTFLYIGMFTAWGVSVHRRVVQLYARRLLSLVAGLMVFWITVREIKFRFVLSLEVIRHLWYSYYIPILLIPMLAVMISLSLGQPESYRPPKGRIALYIVTFSLLGLVMTNDLHRLVFNFNDGQVWTEFDYRHGLGYFVVVGWVLLCAASAIFIMLRRSRMPGSKRSLWVPLIPVFAAVAHTILYIIGVPFVRMYLDDLAVFECLMFLSFFEGCIGIGLIQTNTRYADLFKAADTPLRIVDASCRQVYAASSAEPIAKEDILRATEQGIILSNGERLHRMPIHGGYAVWTEDISMLLNAAERLRDIAEELNERNAFLRLEYERERRHKTVEEQNRLYNLLQSKTQSQIDQIDRLVDEYARAAFPEEKSRILAYILVLGSYIKRRKNFVLSVNSEAPWELLDGALAESYRSLALLSIRGGHLVDCGQQSASSDLPQEAYDFFEQVVERVMDTARYLNTRVVNVEGELRMVISTDVAMNADDLLQDNPALEIAADEDGTTLVLPLKGGETVC